MKQKFRRFMAGFLALLTVFSTLLGNGSTAFAASKSANIAFWYASVKDSGEVSELKKGYDHGKILYSILDGNAAYCMNFGLSADGGQLMNSYDNPSTDLSAAQEKLLSYCLYYGFNSNSATAPTNGQCNKYIATQAMVWVIVANIYGTDSADSAAKKLCNTAPDADASYDYYKSLKKDINLSYYATRPSFASKTKSGADTYVLKWNESNQRFEKTLTDSNGVLDDYDISLDGFTVKKSGNSVTISCKEVNTTAAVAKMTSNAGAVETTSSCVFWLTGKSGYQEFISEKPSADPLYAYFKVKTENIGYGEITKTDESSGVKLSGAVYGIYSDSGCTSQVDTMTTDSNGYAKSGALTAGTYYVKEITAPKGYVLSGKVHTLTVKAGQTTGISATDKEQLGSLTIYKEGEVLTGWDGSNFTYETRKLPGAVFQVTAGADIYKADGTRVYGKGDLIAENLVTGSNGQAVLSDLHLGTYVVTETKSIDGYTINTTPQTVTIAYKDQIITVDYEDAPAVGELTVEKKGEVLASYKGGLFADSEEKSLEALGIQTLHIDVADGMFVPSITFGMPVIQSIRPKSHLFFDVHLMIEEPKRYLEAFAEAGADSVTVHYEACKDVGQTLADIRRLGKQCAIAISPDTAVEQIVPYLEQVQMVLVMSVYPGFGGQKLLPKTLEKIKRLAALRSERGLDYRIEIDGGINLENIGTVVGLGTDIIVAGTAVFRGNIRENVERIREVGEHASGKHSIG